MSTDDYVNTNIRDELIRAVQEVLDEDEIFPEGLSRLDKIEYALEDVIDSKFFYDSDEWGILYEWGDLSKIRESTIYQEACEKCIEDVIQELS